MDQLRDDGSVLGVVKWAWNGVILIKMTLPTAAGETKERKNRLKFCKF